jgi:hypothetical protein
MQIYATILILVAAIAYAAWRLYNTFHKDGDPCAGCDMKKNCKKSCQYK